MKYQIYGLLLVAIAACCVLSTQANSKSKVGPRLRHFLDHGDVNGVLPKRTALKRSDGGSEETTAIWVLFGDKCGGLPTTRELTEKAIARRAKHGYGITNEDRPVCESFKISVEYALKKLSHPITPRQESKWLNGVSYTIAISDLEQAVTILEAMNIVVELEVVGRMIRDTNVDQQTSESSENLQKRRVDFVHDQERKHLEILKTVTGSHVEPPRGLKRIQHRQESWDQVVSETKHDETHTMQQSKNLGVDKRAASDSAKTLVNLDYGTSESQLSRISIPAMHQLGFNGSGVVIAVLDTGFNRNHESLRDLTVLDAYDFVYNDTNVNDEGSESGPSSHGTGTWSNVGGRKPGQLYGGSYDASFLLYKTEDTRSETSAEEDNFVRAVERSEAYGADILSASLGYNGWLKWEDLNGQRSIIARHGKRAIDLGLLFVVANGNSGEGGIGTPADMDRVVAVGALAVSPPTQVTGFSSRGPTSDNRIKPEVCAPGSRVKVASYRDNVGYNLVDGTSFACPLTAGAAGLLLQAHPTWTNMQLRNALINTATPMGSPTPNIVFGWGIVNTISAHGYIQPTNPDPSTCIAPYGSWSTETNTCQCASDYYNFDCRTPKLSCRDWCQGLCDTNGLCLCATNGARRCSNNATVFSTGWTCERSAYNDGTTCNCGCGLYDPDCNIPNAPVVGCNNPSDTCAQQGSTGVCVADANIPLAPTMAQAPATPAMGPTMAPAAETPTPASAEPSKEVPKHYGIFASILLAILALFVR